MKLHRAELEVVYRDENNNMGYGNDTANLDDIRRELKDWGYPVQVVEPSTCKDEHISCTTLEVYDLTPGKYILVPL